MTVLMQLIPRAAGTQACGTAAQIEGAHSVGVTGVSWAPATPAGSLVSGQGATAPDRRIASSGCDNAVKVRRLEVVQPACFWRQRHGMQTGGQ